MANPYGGIYSGTFKMNDSTPSLNITGSFNVWVDANDNTVTVMGQSGQIIGPNGVQLPWGGTSTGAVTDDGTLVMGDSPFINGTMVINGTQLTAIGTWTEGPFSGTWELSGTVGIF